LRIVASLIETKNPLRTLRHSFIDFRKTMDGDAE